MKSAIKQPIRRDIKRGVRSGSAAPGIPELTPIAGVSNWTRANNSRILAALAAMKAGASDVRVGVYGDSTTAAFGGTPVDGWNGARAVAPPRRMAVALAAGGIPATSDDIIGRSQSATFFNSYISPETITLGTNWNTGLGSIGGGGLGNTNFVTDVFTYVSAVAGTAARVITYQYTAAGSTAYEVSFDGGSTWVGGGGAGAAANNGIRVDTFVNPGAASTELRIRRITGVVNVQGVELIDATGAKAIRITNAGEGSTTTLLWTTTTNVYSVGNVYYKMGTHLAIINLTINDRSSIADPAAPMTRLATMVANLQAADSDVWLVVPNPGNNCTTTVLNNYRAAILAQAAALNVPCIDLMDPLATLGAWQAPTNFMYDGIHPNGTGYDYIGGRYAEAMAALHAAA